MSTEFVTGFGFLLHETEITGNTSAEFVGGYGSAAGGVLISETAQSSGGPASVPLVLAIVPRPVFGF